MPRYSTMPRDLGATEAEDQDPEETAAGVIKLQVQTRPAARQHKKSGAAILLCSITQLAALLLWRPLVISRARQR